MNVYQEKGERMVIAHNLSVMNTATNMKRTQKRISKSMEKLSTGYKISRSADDAAGLTISEKMRWQIRGLNQSSRNVQDGISLVQVADGALGETTAILQRMRELAVQGGNDTNTGEDRIAIQNEIDELSKEIDEIANTTTFNKEIYPLLGDKEVSWSYTASVSTSARKITISGSDVEIDGKKYNDGDEVTISVIKCASQSGDGSYMEYWGDGSSTYHAAGEGNIVTTVGSNIKSVANTNVKIDTKDGSVYYSDMNGSTVYLSSPEGSIMAKHGPGNLELPDGKLNIQAGAKEGQNIELQLVDATAENIGIVGVSVMSNENAGKAITAIDNAIDTVSSYRSKLGAMQNRLEYAMRNLDNTAENTQYAESEIRDTDIAREMMELAKDNIVMQASQSVMSQEMKGQESILQLING